jgi:hypothetical protein
VLDEGQRSRCDLWLARGQGAPSKRPTDTFNTG